MDRAARRPRQPRSPRAGHLATRRTPHTEGLFSEEPACFPAGSPQGSQAGNGPPDQPQVRPARASLRDRGRVRAPRPTPLSSGVRFLCKSERNSSSPAAFPGARAHAPCCLPSRALRGVSPSPRDAVPCALSSPVPQTPFPPAVPAALTGPRLDWEQPPLRTLSAEHVDILAEMVPSRTGKSSLNRRTRLAEPPRDWGHHRFFSGRRATGDQSWVPMAGRRMSGSAKDHASGGSSAGRGGRPGPPGQFWNARPVRWARTTKSGRTPPREYVAITSLLFFCISNLFREQERYLTIT